MIWKEYKPCSRNAPCGDLFQDVKTLCSSLCFQVLEASMNSSDSSSDPPLATAKPWVLLYKITEQ